MNYKIYIVKNEYHNNLMGFPIQLIEAAFNWGCGCDSIEEAKEMIIKEGAKGITYTILPYIYF